MTKLIKPQQPDNLMACLVEHQQNLSAMEESGDLNRVARIFAMAYETFSVANTYANEAIAIMERYNLVHKKVKTTANNLNQSFHAFDNVMGSMLGSIEACRQFVGDFNIMREMLDAFMRYDISIKRGPYFTPTLFLPKND